MRPPREHLDCLRLQQMRVDCVVGVYPAERHRPEPLQLDLALYLDTRGAAYGGGLDKTVDYACLFGELRFILLSCRFLLLEEASAAICRYVLAEPSPGVARARPAAVELRLTKVNALQGLAVPSLEVFRSREDVSYQVRETGYGAVDIIYETRSCGIYRRRIAPGSAQLPHRHDRMEEHELVMSDGIFVQDIPADAGTARSWPRGHIHKNSNPTDAEQSILCVNRPAFVAADEIHCRDRTSLRTVDPVRFVPPVAVFAS